MQRQKRERFQAGTAKICITPRPEDITEFRTLGREQFLGVRQEMYARALVLQAGDRKVLILGADLIKMPEYLRLRDKLAERYGFKPTDIIMGGTQNHQCIVPDPPWTPEEERPPVLIRVRDKIHEDILEGVAAAFENMKPARIGWATGSSYINTNRDLTSAQRTAAGDPGFADRELFVLRVDSEEGEPIACLLNYCMMGTMMGAAPDNWIGGDIHGAISAGLEAAIGGDFIAPYLIGGSANATPLIHCNFDAWRPVEGKTEKVHLELPLEAREMLRDLLATQQIEDALALYKGIRCSVGNLFFRSGELFEEVDARRIPERTAGDDAAKRDVSGRLTHRLHLLSLGDELVFACGNSITSMRLGKLVKDSLPVRTVYVSVEGGSIGYVMDAEADPDWIGCKRSPLYSTAENEVVYLEGFRKLWETAD